MGDAQTQPFPNRCASPPAACANSLPVDKACRLLETCVHAQRAVELAVAKGGVVII